MIIKISLQLHSLAWEYQPGKDLFDRAEQEVKRTADFLQSARGLIHSLQVHGETMWKGKEKITALFTHHFGVPPIVKEYTKKKRTYSHLGLTITEEEII